MVQETMMATPTKKTSRKATKRTEQEILDAIMKLTLELEGRNARSLIRCAVQEIVDRRNGKDW
jgi:hypothetical protein